jgi:predicted metal-dependent phosphoesterase TrpH
MLSIRHDIDLHCHSTASDGMLSPAELIARAQEAGIRTLALTDHDTLAGSESLAQVPEGMRVIPGVELSCAWRGVNLHILAYGPSWKKGAIDSLLQCQKARRFQRAEIIARRLGKALSIENLLQKVLLVADQADVPGRPHFAKCLLDEGVVTGFDDAFNRFLGAGKTGDVRTCWPTLEELMTCLLGAEAVVSLAHPMHYKQTATRLRTLLDEFVALGGHCIEISVPGMDSGHFGWLTEAAKGRGLGQSFGSDYHGGGMPWRQLGMYPKLAEGLPALTEWLQLPA